MKRLPYILILLLLSAVIVPILWSSSFGAGTSSTSSLNKGLIGYWDMDQTSLKASTTIADKSPNGHNGTLEAGVGFTADYHGQANRAASFPGSKEITIGTDSFFASSQLQTFSVSAWFKKTGAGRQTIVGRGDTGVGNYDWWIYVSENDDLGMAIYNNAPGLFIYAETSSGNWGDGNWHHVVATININAPALYIYLDGSTNPNASDITSVGTINSNSVILGIGRYVGSYGDWNGSIDDVRIYNRALSQTEVTQLYGSYNPKQSVGSLEKGLVAHYPLSQDTLKSSTTIDDTTPNNNTGTLVGSPTFTTDQKGQTARAMSFDGSDDKVSLSYTTSSSLNLTSNFAISVWVYLNSYTSDKTSIIQADNGSDLDYSFNFGYDSVDKQKVSFRMGSSSVLSTSDIPLSTWTLITGAYDGALKLYLNGTLNNTGGSSTHLVCNRFLIGSNKSIAGRYLAGKVTDVRIYNRALSSTEVTSLYNSYRPKISTGSLNKGLVGEWKLRQADAKSSTITDDYTPNNNDGTLVNSPTYTTDRHNQANKAMSFTAASSQYVWKSIADYRSADSAGTISAWIKTSSTSADQAIFTSYDEATASNYGLLFYVNDSPNVICIFQRNNDTQDWVQGSTTISDGLWHHVVVTSTGSVYAIYVDGNTESLTVSSGLNNGDWLADTSNRDNFVIGARKYNSVQEYFNGSVYDVRVYNRALSATEVTALYNSY